MKEHEIQNQIRDFLNMSTATFFRVNVLAGFTGHYQRLSNGSVLIQNPSYVKSGVPAGFPDLIGIKPVTITSDLVGKTIGQFCFIEVKTEKGRVSRDQAVMMQMLKESGALGGIAHSVDEAKALIF